MLANSTSLNDMRDIVVTEPVSWWPLAPGWYVLFFALALVLIWSALKSIKRWRQAAYLRQAMHELDRTLPSELPGLVKRVCLSKWPRTEVATLSGDRLLHWLDQSGNTKEFTTGSGQLLLALSYHPQHNICQESDEYQQLIKLLKHWIAQCRTAL